MAGQQTTDLPVEDAQRTVDTGVSPGLEKKPTSCASRVSQLEVSTRVLLRSCQSEGCLYQRICE